MIRIKCKGRRGWDLLNFILMLGVCVPPALLLSYSLQTCPDLVDATHPTNLNANPSSPVHLFGRWLYTITLRSDTLYHQSDLINRAACELFLWHPIVWVNVAYFVFVDIGFYIIYLLQGSTWLIDPHWQLLPMCMSLFYYVHPNAIVIVGADGGGGAGAGAGDGAGSLGVGGGIVAATAHHPRAVITLILLWLWGFRLLNNYFRREEWHVGEREDWRYADMRKQHGYFFLVTQFFAVSLAQHGMLVGLTMPLSAAMSSSGEMLNWLDGVALCLCLTGILVGFVADNQLYAYMTMKNKPVLLETGLWRYSRHPNHFGEQTWWVGLLLFGVASGAPLWPICFGVLFNHPLDTLVTLPMIEQRMLRRPERVAAFKEYQQCTSLIVPLPPSVKQKRS
jgi:steroid 5-alpha reductase family enzyme